MSGVWRSGGEARSGGATRTTVALQPRHGGGAPVGATVKTRRSRGVATVHRRLTRAREGAHGRRGRRGRRGRLGRLGLVRVARVSTLRAD